jgi:hypothetical protein
MKGAVRCLSAIALAACTTATAPEAGVDRTAALDACSGAVAAHVGKPREAVTATWTDASTVDGLSVVSVTDATPSGERLHTCEIDTAGRVHAILHPGA